MASSGGDWSGRGTEGMGHLHGVQKPGTWGGCKVIDLCLPGGWM